MPEARWHFLRTRRPRVSRPSTLQPSPPQEGASPPAWVANMAPLQLIHRPPSISQAQSGSTTARIASGLWQGPNPAGSFRRPTAPWLDEPRIAHQDGNRVAHPRGIPSPDAMHVLFVHKNFPAQFGHIAAYLAEREGYECTFVSERPPGEYRGVRRLQYKIRGGARKHTHYCSRSFENFTWHSHSCTTEYGATHFLYRAPPRSCRAPDFESEAPKLQPLARNGLATTTLARTYRGLSSPEPRRTHGLFARTLPHLDLRAGWRYGPFPAGLAATTQD